MGCFLKIFSVFIIVDMDNLAAKTHPQVLAANSISDIGSEHYSAMNFIEFLALVLAARGS